MGEGLVWVFPSAERLSGPLNLKKSYLYVRGGRTNIGLSVNGKTERTTNGRPYDKAELLPKGPFREGAVTEGDWGSMRERVICSCDMAIEERLHKTPSVFLHRKNPPPSRGRLYYG